MKCIGNKWSVCLSATLGGISLAIVQNKVPPIIKLLSHDFGINAQQAGWLSSIFALIGIFIAIPASGIIKKYPAKWVGIFSLLIAIIGSVNGYCASGFFLLLISRIIEGTGVGIVAVLGPSLISLWFEPDERGLPMGIWTSWMTISQAILFFISGSIAKHWGWHGMWFVGIACCVISLILYFLFVTEPVRKTQFKTTSARSFKQMEGIKSVSSWMLTLSALFYAVCSFSFVTWISVVWSTNVGIEITEISKFISGLYVLEIFFTILNGWIFTRIRRRQKLGMVYCLLYGIIGFFAFNFVHSIIALLIVVVIFPFFDGGIPTLLFTLAPQTQRNSQNISLAVSLTIIGMKIGMLCAGPFFGWLVDIHGNIGLIFLVSAIGALIFMKLINIYEKN